MYTLKRSPLFISILNWSSYIAIGIFILSPIFGFGQRFEENFIQYSRDVEKSLVTVTEGQISWINESTKNILKWNREDLTVDEMPRMSGCENIQGDNSEKKKCAEGKMLEYIYKNLVYPLEAIEDRIEGRVFISFYVNPDGKLSNAMVQKGLGGYTAGAALDVIDKMNSENIWIPGKSKGLAIPTLYTLPILFKLGREYSIQHPKMYSKYYETNNDWELVYDTEGEPTLNEAVEVRILISDNGKVLNTRIYDPLTPVAKERANEIILDLLDNSTWRPGSTYRFENTMEYVFTLKM